MVKTCCLCDICGDKIICHLQSTNHNDIVGYCENCCHCQDSNCTQRIVYRVYQTHHSGSLTFIKMHDLCEKHTNDFIESINEEIIKHPFVYL
jgi:hypothetical protein